MKSAVIKVGGGLIATLLGVGLASAIPGAGSPSERKVDRPVSMSLKVAEDKLRNNLTQLERQEDEELKDVASRFELPAGASFGDTTQFDEVNEQLTQIKAQKQFRSSGQKFEPTVVWVEPGGFKSDALVQWQCAWLKDAVLAQEAGDTSKRDAGIKRLLDFKKAPESSMFPDYEVFLEENVYPLMKGNADNARDFINSGYTCAEENQLPKP